MMAASIALGAMMSSVLWVFYRHVEDEWPTAYGTVSSKFDLFSRRVIGWHLASRLVVVFAASALTAHVAIAFGGNASVAVGVLALSHVWLTSVRALREARSLHHRGALVATYNAILTVLLLAAAWLGLVVAPHVPWAFPSADALVDALWIAIAVAVALTAIQRLARISYENEDSKTAQATLDVGVDAIAALDTSAARHDAHAGIMRAIVLAEALQRPRWIRRIERAVGRFRPGGTYGVAQVWAERPLSDADSLDLLGEGLAGSASRLRGCDEDTAYLYAEAYFEEHNPDRVFIDQALEFFTVSSSSESVLAESEAMSTDGRRVIEVLSVTRAGFEWNVAGTWMPQSADDVLTFAGISEATGASDIPAVEITRRRWSIPVSFEDRALGISAGDQSVEVDPLEFRWM